MGVTYFDLIDEHFLSRLPYETRRWIISLVRPRRRRAFIRMREEVSEEGYSFKPFLERQAIFVHIPKCAGISVCRSLFGNLGGGHFPIKDYSLAFSRGEFEAFYKFTFVRNPWDRLVSAYEFLRQGGRNDRDLAWARDILEKHRDFEHFVRHWLTPANCGSTLHFIPQYRFLCLPGHREPAVDFIGHYERLADDFRVVRNRLGLTCDLADENRTQSRTDYRDYYSDASRHRVEEVYGRDIELFGYDFDNTAFRQAGTP